ncbi:class I SAM-dependent methyltransferase [Paenibacillus albiflavus]|uniref:Class I SAM-dependent methyltransferase n=1 Tax=Paenibacillus albiflavus TaxID=2545760 RepID=A0A4R4DZY9_9BACL|nr:class I SAM-dependent methyltransferase [Paenibacillus albiflavus]TCZ69670.1 class I SAM-dependent methyltransferase [Paenibacillus albiflavus]
MNPIIDYYSRFDEWGRLDREPLEFTINWHYMTQYLPTSGTVLDNGAGPGKYSMELAKLGYNVTLSDITPKLVEIAEEKASELGLTEQFSGFHVLNATHLEGVPSEIFDASLMLGPLYHLQNEEDRKSAVRELFRVTKKNGIVFVAFQSRMRMTLTSLQFPQHWKPNDNLDSINQFYEQGIFDHHDKGRFTGAYYFHMDEIKPFMESNGLVIPLSSRQMKKAMLPARIDTQSVRVFSVWFETVGSYKSKYNLPRLDECQFLIYTV